MALTVAVAATVILINLMLDLVYHWADPRFRVH
jgi:ABC-type dipeptide/oligopeptide/nickel transport system permease component